jgi:hypothetical protein
MIVLCAMCLAMCAVDDGDLRLKTASHGTFTRYL